MVAVVGLRFSLRDTTNSTVIAKSCGADVMRLRPNQPSFAKLLQAMSGPAEYTSHGEGRSEQFGRQSQAV